MGHILDSDLGDTVKRIDSTGFAEVMDLSLTMPNVDETSLRLSQNSRYRQGPDPEGPEQLFAGSRLGKKLLVIEPIEAEAV